MAARAAKRGRADDTVDFSFERFSSTHHAVFTFALSRAKPVEPAPLEEDLQEADAEKLERELEQILEMKQAKRRRRAQQGGPRAIAQAAEARYAPPPPTAQEDDAEDAADGDEYRDEGKAAPRSWKPITEEGKRMVLQALDRAIKCVLLVFLTFSACFIFFGTVLSVWVCLTFLLLIALHAALYLRNGAALPDASSSG
jgi:hypothetical protein